MIDLDGAPSAEEVFAAAAVSEKPFPHFVIPEFFTPGLCEAVLGWLERDIAWEERHIDDFYDLLQVTLGDESPPAELRSLTSPELTGAMARGFERLYGRRLSRQVEMTAHKMMKGFKIKVHTDFSEDRFCRLVVQLNRGWSVEAGGVLVLLDSREANEATDDQRYYLPISGSAVGFQISERSFHAVSPVHSGDRYTLSYTFSPAAD